MSLELRGLERLKSFRRNEDSVLSSSQSVFSTRDVHIFLEVERYQSAKFYILIGLGKLSTGKAWDCN